MRNPRRDRAPDERNRVASYLDMRRLRRQVLAKFDGYTDAQWASFWLHDAFKNIRTKRANESDRLSLENVQNRLNHCPNVARWEKWYNQHERGKMTLPELIAKIISTSKS